jgi:hypothetical protein
VARRGQYPWPVGQRRYRGRRLPRYKKTALLIAGVGVATGVAAVILWPQLKSLFQTPLITVGKPTIGPASEIDVDFVNSLPYDNLMRGI